MGLRKGALEAMVNASFWKNKRVFVTGHTGFKGSWLSLWLKEMGAKVYGYALMPPSEPSLFELADVHSVLDHQLGDVRNFSKLADSVQQFKPEIVLHLAAQSLVRPSYEDPIGTYATNVMGTVHLLEAVRQSSQARVVINVTSDKCYENREWVWGYREDEAMGGYDPYSSSKGSAELVTSAYRRSFFHPEKYQEHGLALASVRAGNVIGGGDFSQDRLIPDLIRAFVQNKNANIRNPEAIRPWQHVLEPLSGYLMLAEKLWENGPQFVGAWNFGPSEDDIQPVKLVANRLATLWGQNAAWEIDRNAHPHEARLLKLDSSKARTLLGWKSKLNLEESLLWVTDWYKAYHAKKPLQRFTVDQIEKYMRD